jgi:hypothetical protein
MVQLFADRILGAIDFNPAAAPSNEMAGMVCKERCFYADILHANFARAIHVLLAYLGGLTGRRLATLWTAMYWARMVLPENKSWSRRDSSGDEEPIKLQRRT